MENNLFFFQIYIFIDDKLYNKKHYYCLKITLLGLILNINKKK